MAKRFLSIFLISLACIITSCNKEKTLANFIDCKIDTTYTHNKVLRDAKNYFEISINNHWKRELFVDLNQSRIYAADTTKDYSSSFIIDVTRFNDRIVLDTIFQNNITNNINNQNKSYVIQEDFFTYNKQQGYGVFYFEHKGMNPTYFLEFYIAYPEHYYVLKSIILGNENFEANVCESMTVLNSFKPIP